MPLQLHQRSPLSSRTARSPLASRATVVRASSCSESTQEPEFIRKVVQVTITATLLQTLMLGRANAQEERAWKPRRHHRRMDEKISDSWAMEVAEKEVAQQEQMRREKKAAQELAKKKKEEEVAKKKAEEEARILRGQQILAQTEAKSKDLPLSLKVGDVEIVPYLVWSLAFAAVAFISRTVMDRMSDSRRTGGRWVYDRSLGGKKVWVPDATATQAMPVAPAKIASDDFDRLVTVAASRASLRSEAKAFVSPSWWNPPPSSFASDFVKESKKLDAEFLLTKIEQQKNLGLDYSLEDIIKLRGLCQEGGVTLKPKTVGARDAIFKTAVEAAVIYAQDQTDMAGEAALLSSFDGGEKPETRFITALSCDLGLEEERAVLITQGVIAAAARARLLDAVKSLKENNEMEVLVSLIKLSSLVQHIPVLQADGPEPDLIASSLKNASSVEERKKILYLLGQLYLEGATVWTAMLGFRAETALTLMETIIEEKAKSKGA